MKALKALWHSLVRLIYALGILLMIAGTLAGDPMFTFLLGVYVLYHFIRIIMEGRMREDK